MIDYFCGQFYADFSKNAYDQVISNGYPSEKVIIGMISGQNFTLIKEEIAKIFTKYSDKFGGVFIWEYFNAPEKWSEEIAKLMVDICFDNYNCNIF